MAQNVYSRTFIWSETLLSVLLCLTICGMNHMNTVEARKNLLFIIDESARPDDFDMYGGVKGVTPSLKKFFNSTGSIFVDQMHTDYPMCNPSRTCILLGRSPETTGIKTNYMDWRDLTNATSWRTLPRFLKDNGYFTLLGGKVFHKGTIDLTAWSKIYDSSPEIDGDQCKHDKKMIRLPFGNGKPMPTMVGCKTKTGGLPDLTLALKAAAELTSYASRKDPRPFAMFVGFQIPHLPIRVNRQYYLPGKNIVSRVPLLEPPRNQSEYTATYSFDAPKHIIPGHLATDSDTSQIPTYVKAGGPFGPNGPLQAYRQSLRLLQLSGLHQTDSACGIVLNAMLKAGFGNETLTIFLTDHGFGYGETRLWEKDIPMDVATRVPFALNVPWFSNTPFHMGPEFFMNTLDMYRTIAGFLELADEVADSVEGRDLSRYFSETAAAIVNDTEPLPTPSSAAFSQVIRCSIPANCGVNLNKVDVVGYTVRTSEYRYTVYLTAVNGTVPNLTRDAIIGEELYDHKFDNLTIFNPNGATYVAHEFRNIVQDEPDIALTLFTLIRDNFSQYIK